MLYRSGVEPSVLTTAYPIYYYSKTHNWHTSQDCNTTSWPGWHAQSRSSSVWWYFHVLDVHRPPKYLLGSPQGAISCQLISQPCICYTEHLPPDQPDKIQCCLCAANRNKAKDTRWRLYTINKTANTSTSQTCTYHHRDLRQSQGKIERILGLGSTTTNKD